MFSCQYPKLPKHHYIFPLKFAIKPKLSIQAKFLEYFLHMRKVLQQIIGDKLAQLFHTIDFLNANLLNVSMELQNYYDFQILRNTHALQQAQTLKFKLLHQID